jgi:hypothetical protein
MAISDLFSVASLELIFLSSIFQDIMETIFDFWTSIDIAIAAATLEKSIASEFTDCC